MALDVGVSMDAELVKAIADELATKARQVGTDDETVDVLTVVAKRSELHTAIDAMQAQIDKLHSLADRMSEILWDKDTEIMLKDSKLTRLNNLLRRGLSALEYHTELTRPIAQTNEVIHEIYAALSEESKGTT